MNAKDISNAARNDNVDEEMTASSPTKTVLDQHLRELFREPSIHLNGAFRVLLDLIQKQASDQKQLRDEFLADRAFFRNEIQSIRGVNERSLHLAVQLKEEMQVMAYNVQGYEVQDKDLDEDSPCFMLEEGDDGLRSQSADGIDPSTLSSSNLNEYNFAGGDEQQQEKRNLFLSASEEKNDDEEDPRQSIHRTSLLATDESSSDCSSGSNDVYGGETHGDVIENSNAFGPATEGDVIIVKEAQETFSEKAAESMNAPTIDEIAEMKGCEERKFSTTNDIELSASDFKNKGNFPDHSLASAVALEDIRSEEKEVPDHHSSSFDSNTPPSSTTLNVTISSASSIIGLSSPASSKVRVRPNDEVSHEKDSPTLLSSSNSLDRRRIRKRNSSMDSTCCISKQKLEQNQTLAARLQRLESLQTDLACGIQEAREASQLLDRRLDDYHALAVRINPDEASSLSPKSSQVIDVNAIENTSMMTISRIHNRILMLEKFVLGFSPTMSTERNEKSRAESPREMKAKNDADDDKPSDHKHSSLAIASSSPLSTMTSCGVEASNKSMVNRLEALEHFIGEFAPLMMDDEISNAGEYEEHVSLPSPPIGRAVPCSYSDHPGIIIRHLCDQQTQFSKSMHALTDQMEHMNTKGEFAPNIDAAEIVTREVLNDELSSLRVQLIAMKLPHKQDACNDDNESEGQGKNDLLSLNDDVLLYERIMAHLDHSIAGKLDSKLLQLQYISETNLHEILSLLQLTMPNDGKFDDGAETKTAQNNSPLLLQMKQQMSDFMSDLDDRLPTFTDGISHDIAMEDENQRGTSSLYDDDAVTQKLMRKSFVARMLGELEAKFSSAIQTKADQESMELLQSTVETIQEDIHGLRDHMDDVTDSDSKLLSSNGDANAECSDLDSHDENVVIRPSSAAALLTLHNELESKLQTATEHIRSLIETKLASQLSSINHLQDRIHVLTSQLAEAPSQGQLEDIKGKIEGVLQQQIQQHSKDEEQCLGVSRDDDKDGTCNTSQMLQQIMGHFKSELNQHYLTKQEVVAHIQQLLNDAKHLMEREAAETKETTTLMIGRMQPQPTRCLGCDQLFANGVHPILARKTNHTALPSNGTQRPYRPMSLRPIRRNKYNNMYSNNHGTCSGGRRSAPTNTNTNTPLMHVSACNATASAASVRQKQKKIQIGLVPRPSKLYNGKIQMPRI
eukprot:CAMPEP_0116039896 /NCGR_PEP_ID=MMETSP0321-20121206/23952_1 /TAXON_ID=163516 /ORGANISM="Leptocylindrus danicus var. danicus, Strain B650" /LENGTH=1188 /DNA_ID=CAMNT_0003519439 /DNA_START=384 /DNA_END=3950 /DNA_ORIENTATION=-